MKFWGQSPPGNLVRIMNKHKSSAYVCVAPELGACLFDYHNGELTEKEAQLFEEHLLFCFRCQNVLRKLVCVFNTLRERRGEFFSAKELELKEVTDRGTAAD